MTIDGFIEPVELEYLVNEKLESVGISEMDHPINPYKLIREEGIILQEAPFDDANIRGMLVNGESVSGIMINSKRSYVSRRFIAMHELCHYWFHPRVTKTVCFEEYTHKYRAKEWQANNAAAYALLPKKLVIDAFNECDGDINMMCGMLHIGKESLTYRIDELGLKCRRTQRLFYYEPDPQLLAWENLWLYGG